MDPVTLFIVVVMAQYFVTKPIDLVIGNTREYGAGPLPPAPPPDMPVSQGP